MVHSHPRWIAQAFADALAGDLDELAQALAADDARPLVHLLARPGQISAAELAASTGGRPAPYSPYGVHLADGGDPGELAPVREHLAQVQDEGSQLVALALAATSLDGTDARWLDLCAGPGGKAALLGALGATRGAVLDAVEKAEHRARLVAALRLTRPGGVVAYVTCSPHFDETVGVVADVVRRTGAEQLDVRAQFPAVPRLGQGPHVQLWPHRHGTDAMFCALLRR
jgi:16S rRNA C967 or C1407 C5-methylase (RsmB/RsmF family)